MKKSMRSVFLGVVFLAVLLSGCAPASTPVPPTPTPIPPTLTPTPIPPPPTPTPIPPTATPPLLSKTRLDITSIPLGSKVYVATLSELGIELGNEGGKDATVRRLLGLNRITSIGDMLIKPMNVVDDKYLRGVTPLSISLKPGNYIVFVEVPSGVQVVGDLLNWLESDSTHGERLAGLINGHTGVTYLVEILDGETNHLNQLWLPKGGTLADAEKIYPEREVFPLNEKEVTATLGGKVAAADIPTVLRLLKKGGKVVYRQGTIRTILELDEQGTLSTVLSYEDAEVATSTPVRSTATPVAQVRITKVERVQSFGAPPVVVHASSGNVILLISFDTGLLPVGSDFELIDDSGKQYPFMGLYELKYIFEVPASAKKLTLVVNGTIEVPLP